MTNKVSVGVVTPTIGKKSLIKCISSVANQTYENVQHYVVADGEEHFDSVTDAYYNGHLPEKRNPSVVYLPDNVGKNGFYGDRVYAAFSYLVNTDYICFLDEDVWLEPSHIESMINRIKSQNLDWCFSLRNIYSEEDGFICRDDCESLGLWKTWNSYVLRQEMFHIDTNCFCVSTPIMVSISGAWYGKYGQDRVFFDTIKHHYPKFHTTGEYTVNYTAGSGETSVKPEFFLQGNVVMKHQYPNGFPWNKENFIEEKE